MFLKANYFFAHEYMKNPPPKVGYFNVISVLLPWAAQTAETVEFMFSNLANIEEMYRKLGLQLQLRARANPVSRGDFVTQCTSTTQSSQNLLFLLHPLIPNIYPSQKKRKKNGGKNKLWIRFISMIVQ